MKSLKEKIINPTDPNLMQKISSNFNKLDYILLYCVQFINQNLFSFISGIIANIPISLILNLLSVNIICNTYGILYLVFYVISIIVSISLCIEAFAFTLKHIDINERARSESDKIIMNNYLVEHYINISKRMKKNFFLTILCGVMTITSLVMAIVFHTLL